MAHRWTPDLTEAHITPEADFLNRRQIMKGMAGIGLSGIGLAPRRVSPKPMKS